MRRRVGRPAPLPRPDGRRASPRAAILSGPGASGGWPPPAKPPESARRRSSVSLNRPRRRPRTPTSQSGHQKAPIGGAVELQTMVSSPSNPVPNPDENSLSHPPRKESQYMLADKVVGQWDDSDTENSSGSASYQIVYYKNAQGENTFLVPPKKRKFTIDTYAVECSTCQKWRIIPSKLKYEQIRENIIHVPFSCKYVHGWKPEVTCHDPTDISEGNGMVWAIDKPAIPQTPPGWERKITLRSEQGTRFADVYYICPAGRKLRSMKEVERCFEDNPDYAAVLQLSQFSFKVPKPPNRPRQSELIEPTEVPPPVHRVPVHNYMPVPHGEANPLTHIPVTLALQVPVMRSKKRKLNQ